VEVLDRKRMKRPKKNKRMGIRLKDRGSNPSKTTFGRGAPRGTGGEGGGGRPGSYKKKTKEKGHRPHWLNGRREVLKRESNPITAIPSNPLKGNKKNHKPNVKKKVLAPEPKKPGKPKRRK